MSFYQKLILIGNLLGIFPYKWNSSEKRFVITSSRVKKLHYIGIFVLYISYFVFLIVRYACLAILKNVLVPSDTVTFQSLIVAASFPLILFVTMKARLDDHLNYINRLVKLDKKYVGRGNKSDLRNKQDETVRNENYVNKRMFTISSFFVLFVILYIIRLKVRPEKAFHLTSLLQNPREMGKAKLILGLLQIYLWSIQWFFINWFGAGLFYHGYVLVKGLSKLLLHEPENNYSRPSEALESISCKYTTLRILQLEHNYLWKSTYSIGFSVAVVGITLNLYQAVALHTMKAAVMGPATWYFVYLIIASGATHYEMSLNILRSWKCHGGGAWFRRFLRSTRPIRTQNGSFGYIDQPLQLTILGIVVTNTVTLVVGHGTI